MYRPVFEKRFCSMGDISGFAVVIIASLSLVSSASARLEPAQHRKPPGAERVANQPALG